MKLFRPEAVATLSRWQEVIAAGVLAGFGLWLFWLGGYLLAPLGVIVIALALLMARLAWRKMRFLQAVGGPGLVEMDEAQVGYLGPAAGGFVSMDELVELRLLVVQGKRMWRLKQADGQALLIPVGAAGAERLFDALAALPGMDTGALVAAVQTDPRGGVEETRVIWRKPKSGSLPSARA